MKTDDALNTWYARMSMDFVIRCFTALLTGILWIIAFLFLGKPGGIEYFGDLDRYENGIMFLVINVVVDIIYFFMVYIYNYYVNKYNIFNCFYVWLNAMNVMENRLIACVLFQLL